MKNIRLAVLKDLECVASWVTTEREVRQWAGPRVSFPVDVGSLPMQIEWERSHSWSVIEGDLVIAFGQVIQKPGQRLHLARLIVSPALRGKSIGRFLASSLLEKALVCNPSTISLNVVTDNRAAIKLYQSLGFTEASRPLDDAPGTSIYMQYITQLRSPAGPRKKRAGG